MLDEVVDGVVDLLDLPHVAASKGSALALRNDMDASYCRRDAIPFFLLSMMARAALHHHHHGRQCVWNPLRSLCMASVRGPEFL